MFEQNNFNQQQNNNYYYQAQPPVPPYNPYPYVPPKQKEKKEMHRAALLIGIPCLCLSLIGFIWPYVYIFLTTNVVGMTYEAAIELSENSAVQQILQIILSCIMFLIPFTIAAKCTGRRIDNLIDFGKAKKGTFLPFLLFGIGFCGFSNIATSYAEQIFQNFGVDYDVDFGDNPSGVFGFLLSFIATAIVPALIEEFACRGIVLGVLKKYGQTFAIISSSLIFGIMHGNFEQIPFAVLVGLVLGYIYVKTGSIWPCMAIHCVNNAASVVFSYLSNVLDTGTTNVLYMVYLNLCLIAAIIGILLYVKKGEENFGLEKEETAITEKEKYTWFFSHWTIIVFIVLNVIESLSYFVV